MLHPSSCLHAQLLWQITDALHHASVLVLGWAGLCQGVVTASPAAVGSRVTRLWRACMTAAASKVCICTCIRTGTHRVGLASRFRAALQPD